MLCSSFAMYDDYDEGTEYDDAKSAVEATEDNYKTVCSRKLIPCTAPADAICNEGTDGSNVCGMPGSWEDCGGGSNALCFCQRGCTGISDEYECQWHKHFCRGKEVSARMTIISLNCCTYCRDVVREESDKAKLDKA